MSQKNKTGEEVVQKPVDLDTILTEELGGFSLYQVRVLILCGLAAAVSSLSTNEYIFTMRRIPTRCLIPECENATGDAEFSPSWLSNAVPSISGSFDNCHRYANVSRGIDLQGTCPATFFDPNTVVKCTEYVYENTNTAVYTLGLACDEWRRSFVGSARTLGALVSLPIAGALSDRWGRRTALTIASFNTAWIGLLRYFATTYIGFVISVFAEAALGAGSILTCAFMIAVETVPPKYRSIAPPSTNASFGFGEIIHGLLAWAFRDWKHLTLVLYTPQLLTLAYLWTYPESIRWNLTKGRYKEVEKVLKRISKSNGKELSDKTMLQLKNSAEQEAKKKDLKGGTWLISKVFHHKQILKRCILVPYLWVTLTFIYFGLSINAVNISGDPYLNYIVVSAVDIPGFWSAFFLLKVMKRKTVLTMLFSICAACQVAYIFIPNDMYAVSLLVYLFGKVTICGVGTTTYVFTSELFPTQYRQTLFGYSSMIGRIGSIAAPFVPALGETIWKLLPYVIFAGMALMAGVLVQLLPETRGCQLPNTMEEAAQMGTKNNFNSVYRNESVSHKKAERFL